MENEEVRSTRHHDVLSETLPVEVQIGPVFVDEGSNLTDLLERDRLYVALEGTSPLVGVPNWLPPS